jgi:propane monooxygenase large subunit
MSTLTLNKITSQKGIPIGEAVRKISDLGWNPSYVQEAMTYPTDYKIAKAPRDPMKQVLRSYPNTWGSSASSDQSLCSRSTQFQA